MSPASTSACCNVASTEGQNPFPAAASVQAFMCTAESFRNACETRNRSEMRMTAIAAIWIASIVLPQMSPLTTLGCVRIHTFAASPFRSVAPWDCQLDRTTPSATDSYFVKPNKHHAVGLSSSYTLRQHVQSRMTVHRTDRCLLPAKCFEAFLWYVCLSAF